MSHLLEAIAAFSQAKLLREPARLLNPQESALLVRLLGAPDPRQKRPEGLEPLRRKLTSLYESSTVNEANRRELRDAPWLLWDGTPPLAELHRLVRAVHLQAADDRRTLLNLIEAWIAAFDPERPAIVETGRRVARILQESSDFRLDLWREAHRQFEFFQAAAGPPRLATRLLSGPETVPETLEAVGLNDAVRGAGGYARALQGQIVTAADKVLRSHGAEQALQRAISFLTIDGKLRFSDLRGPLAQGLTAPWQQVRGGVTPRLSHNGVCDFLVTHLKDPRTHPGNWQSAGEPTTGLVRQWLVRASLDMFFGLIAQFSNDKIWQWRGAFWKACMDRCVEKRIPFDAWVIFGSQIQEVARASRELKGAYGSLTGAASNQAAMMMQVGPIVCCEWSFNGALRAWPHNSKQAPTFRKPTYDRDELKVDSLPFPADREGRGGERTTRGLWHIGSNRNFWQNSAAEFLARHVGIRLTAADWQPQ